MYAVSTFAINPLERYDGHGVFRTFVSHLHGVETPLPFPVLGVRYLPTSQPTDRWIKATTTTSCSRSTRYATQYDGSNYARRDDVPICISCSMSAQAGPLARYPKHSWRGRSPLYTV